MGCYLSLGVRVVLDTSVVAAGLRSRRGASFVLLRAIAAQELVPLVSIALFLEYEDVLKRTEQREATGMAIADVDAFLGGMAAAAEPVEVHMLWRPQLRDVADEMVLETAVNGRAEALVTYNVRDFIPAAERFDLSVQRPRELLALNSRLWRLTR